MPLKMKKLIYILALLGISFLFSCENQDAQKPNIIFIMADDHTSQAFGVYGSRLAGLDPTPHIDRLALKGSCLKMPSVPTPYVHHRGRAL